MHIHQDLRDTNDKGDPLTHSNPDHEVSKLFKGNKIIFFNFAI